MSTSRRDPRKFPLKCYMYNIPPTGLVKKTTVHVHIHVWLFFFNFKNLYECNNLKNECRIESENLRRKF